MEPLNDWRADVSIQSVPYGKFYTFPQSKKDFCMVIDTPHRNRPYYDAAYVALASSRASVVYTADERLIESVTESEYGDIASHVRSYDGLTSSD